jgi:hypothetical protein
MSENMPTRFRGPYPAAAVPAESYGAVPSAPLVVLSGGGGTGATAGTVTLSSQTVTAIAVSTGGSGYNAPPDVVISGGGGAGARAYCTLTAGVVTAITVSNVGSGYTSQPTVTIVPAGNDRGRQATTLVTMSAGAVASIAVGLGGQGYNNPPTISFVGGGGSGASFTAAVSGGAVTTFTQVSGGSGYSMGAAATNLAAINNALAANKWVSLLTPGTFLVNGTVNIPSGCRLTLGPFTKIQLAGSSSCCMIQNTNISTGDQNIIVEGGIWDGNSVNNAEPSGADLWRGLLANFQKVWGLVIRDITLQDATKVCLTIGDGAQNVIIDNITLVGNCAAGSTDGIDFFGPCSNVTINRVYGYCTDNMIGLGTWFTGSHPSPSGGDITDFEISNIYPDNMPMDPIRFFGGNTGGWHFRRIHIRDLHGSTTSSNAVVWFYDDTTDGYTGATTLDDILIENVYTTFPAAGKCIQVAVAGMGKLTVRNVVVNVAAFSGMVVAVMASSSTSKLIVDGITYVQGDGVGNSVWSRGTIGELKISNVNNTTTGAHTVMASDAATISHLRISDCYLSGTTVKLLQLTNTTTDVVVEDCTVEGSWTTSAQIDIGSTTTRVCVHRCYAYGGASGTFVHINAAVNYVEVADNVMAAGSIFTQVDSSATGTPDVSLTGNHAYCSYGFMAKATCNVKATNNYFSSGYYITTGNTINLHIVNHTGAGAPCVTFAGTGTYRVSGDGTASCDGTKLTPGAGDMFYNTNSSYSSGVGQYATGGSATPTRIAS